MVNVPSTWNISDYRDFISLDYYDDVKAAGGNVTVALENLSKLARDNARTPFNWNSTHGFSSNKTTWTPQVHPEINLADQMRDSNSVYNFWRSMLSLRKYNKNLFVYGNFRFLELKSERFLVYEKTAGCDRVMVILNFSKEKCKPPISIPRGARLLANTHVNGTDSTFDAFEGRVYKI